MKGHPQATTPTMAVRQLVCQKWLGWNTRCAARENVLLFCCAWVEAIRTMTEGVVLIGEPVVENATVEVVEPRVACQRERRWHASGLSGCTARLRGPGQVAFR